MREIKFRVWTGSVMEYKIVAGKLGVFYVEGIDQKDSASMSQFNTIYPDTTPVMQYTGLKDKIGKEIYEGDILKQSLGQRELIGVMYFNSQKAQFGFEASIETEKKVPEHIELKTKPEIIGNIYENPNLLESHE